MRTKIYVKADKFVDRVVELYNLMCSLDAAIRSTALHKNNYMDACIRTYAFKYAKGMNVYCLNSTSDIYKEIICYGTDKPLMVRGGYKFNLQNKEVQNEFSTVNNSEESEFQLLMIHDEHEIFVQYVKEKIRERIPEVNSIFLATMDIRRLNPAIKAAKELIDGYNSKSNKSTNSGIND